MRITWLLLSLGFLCHSICSQSANATAHSSSPDKPPESEKHNTSNPSTDVNIIAPSTESGNNSAETTQAPQLLQTAAAPASITTAAIDKPGTSTTFPKQVPTITSNLSPASVFHAIVNNNATLRTTWTTIPATTAQHTAAVQTPSVPGPTSRTEVSTSRNMGAPSITKPPTNGHTGDQLSTPHTSITSNVNPKAGITEQTAPGNPATPMPPGNPGTLVPPGNTGTPVSPGNPGTTGPLSTMTKAVPVKATSFTPNMSTTAKTMALQPTLIAAAISSTTPLTTFNQTSKTTLKMLQYSLHSSHEKDDKNKNLVEVCKRLMVNLYKGNCTLIWTEQNGKVKLDSVNIDGTVERALATQYYDEITKTATDNKTLIAILASCGALLIMIVILTVCASHHRKPYSENQQHLTEELHTVENGYHDNPTLEVMEVQPEMQEKKVTLNGEFNDSWIVPIDNLLKEEIADEEDTHL